MSRRVLNQQQQQQLIKLKILFIITREESECARERVSAFFHFSSIFDWSIPTSF